MTTAHRHHNHSPEEGCNAACFAEVETEISDREHRFFAALTRIKHHAELLASAPSNAFAFASALPDFIQQIFDGQNPHEVSLP